MVIDDSIATWYVTCEAAPLQIEGTLASGEFFYFRSRHRGLSLGIGDTLDAAVEDPYAVAMTVEGWEFDRHPLSSLSGDPMPLVKFLIGLRTAMLNYGKQIGQI